MVVENDLTRDVARAVVIVAAVRLGGTFLAHALSNHPHIHCDRGEPLHHASVWCQALHPDRTQLLAALLNQTGYQVAMCKLTYAQAFNRAIWPWLVRRRPAMIWLRRENTLRQAVSVLINQAARAGTVKRAQHTFVATRPIQVAFPPETVLRMARGLAAADKRAEGQLAALPNVLRITYADVVGGELAAASRLPVPVTRLLCTWLSVRYARLDCELRRVNPQSLAEMLTNWHEVEVAVRDSEFAACLEDEKLWRAH